MLHNPYLVNACQLNSGHEITDDKFIEKLSAHKLTTNGNDFILGKHSVDQIIKYLKKYNELHQQKGPLVDTFVSFNHSKLKQMIYRLFREDGVAQANMPKIRQLVREVKQKLADEMKK